MEDFSRGAGPKRAPPQRLYEYFFEISDLNKYVLDQQAIVRENSHNWLDLPQDERDEALDAGFAVPEMPEYEEAHWGRSIQDVRELAAARERHLQWQREIADFKKKSKKWRMSTQASLSPGLATRPSTIVELPSCRSFKSEIVKLDPANEESASSTPAITPNATSGGSAEEKRFEFPPQPKEPGTPATVRRRPVTELISLMEKKLPLAVKNMKAVTNTESPSPSGPASRSMSMSLTPRASVANIAKKKSNDSIISGELDLAMVSRHASHAVVTPMETPAITPAASARPSVCTAPAGRNSLSVAPHSAAVSAAAAAAHTSHGHAATSSRNSTHLSGPAASTAAAAAPAAAAATGGSKSRPLSSSSTATFATHPSSNSTTTVTSAAGSTANMALTVTMRPRTQTASATCRGSGTGSRPTSGSSRPNSGRTGSSENLSWRNSGGSAHSEAVSSSSSKPSTTCSQKQEASTDGPYRRRGHTVDPGQRPVHLLSPEKRASVSAADHKEKKHEASPLQLVHTRGQPKDVRVVLTSAGESSSDAAARPASIGARNTAPAPDSSSGSADPLSELAGLLMGKATLEDLLASMNTTFDA